MYTLQLDISSNVHIAWRADTMQMSVMLHHLGIITFIQC